MQEAAALDQLSHPGIVRLRHCGYADPGLTRPYIVMEYFDGPTREEPARKHGPLPLPAALAVGRQVAEALRAAHGHGILHRDVKPANLLLRRDAGEPGGSSPRSPRWEARLIDF